MSREVHVVCRPEVAVGFRLAGVGVHDARDAAEASAVIARLQHAGVVLLQERLVPEHAGTPDRPRSLPVVVPFPDPGHAEGAAHDHVVEILRRAIGYRVRLR